MGVAGRRIRLGAAVSAFLTSFPREFLVHSSLLLERKRKAGVEGFQLPLFYLEVFAKL
jgi:hypothetical protein